MGKDHQLIIALKPEKIQMIQNKETITIEKGLVSFTMQELSSDDAFQCIVHPKMLNGIRNAEEARPAATSINQTEDEVVL